MNESTKKRIEELEAEIERLKLPRFQIDEEIWMRGHVNDYKNESSHPYQVCLDNGYILDAKEESLHPSPAPSNTKSCSNPQNPQKSAVEIDSQFFESKEVGTEMVDQLINLVETPSESTISDKFKDGDEVWIKSKVHSVDHLDHEAPFEVLIGDEYCWFGDENLFTPMEASAEINIPVCLPASKDEKATGVVDVNAVSGRNP